MPAFRPGDTLKCLSADRSSEFVTRGMHYEVKEIFENRFLIDNDLGERIAPKTARFEKVPRPS